VALGLNHYPMSRAQDMTLIVPIKMTAGKTVAMYAECLRVGKGNASVARWHSTQCIVINFKDIAAPAQFLPS
jgi:hypothetical protein